MMASLIEQFTRRAEALGATVRLTSRAGTTDTIAPGSASTSAAGQWLAGSLRAKGEHPNVVAIGRLGVVETGSVLLVEPAADRAACLLADHLWVILPASQLVLTLPDALARAAALVTTEARSLLFISGPSRTGDIERVLTIGVHGPAALTILLVSDP
jgi:hypothetical protein